MGRLPLLSTSGHASATKPQLCRPRHRRGGALLLCVDGSPIFLHAYARSWSDPGSASPVTTHRPRPPSTPARSPARSGSPPRVGVEKKGDPSTQEQCAASPMTRATQLRLRGARVATRAQEREPGPNVLRSPRRRRSRQSPRGTRAARSSKRPSRKWRSGERGGGLSYDRSSYQGAMMEAAAKDKALVNLATGLEDAERVLVAFLVATAALSQGKQVVIWARGGRPAWPAGRSPRRRLQGLPAARAALRTVRRRRRRALALPDLPRRSRPRRRREGIDARVAGATPVWEWAGNDTTVFSY